MVTGVRAAAQASKSVRANFHSPSVQLIYPRFLKLTIGVILCLIESTNEAHVTIDTYLSRASAPNYLLARGLRFSKNTLAKLATVGGGPEYRTFGGRAYYTEAALDAWVDEKLSAPRRSTSDVL